MHTLCGAHYAHMTHVNKVILFIFYV